MGKQQWMLLLVSVILLLMSGCVGTGRSYALDHDVKDGSYQMQPKQFVQPTGFREPIRFQINGEPEADGSGRCNLMAGNPQENAWDLCVTVRLDENEKELYRSKVLNPGERETYVNLVTVLVPGRYHATAEFTVLDRESGEVTGTMEAGITITVAD